MDTLPSQANYISPRNNIDSIITGIRQIATNISTNFTPNTLTLTPTVQPTQEQLTASTLPPDTKRESSKSLNSNRATATSPPVNIEDIARGLHNVHAKVDQVLKVASQIKGNETPENIQKARSLTTLDRSSLPRVSNNPATQSLNNLPLPLMNTLDGYSTPQLPSINQNQVEPLYCNPFTNSAKRTPELNIPIPDRLKIPSDYQFSSARMKEFTSTPSFIHTKGLGLSPRMDFITLQDPIFTDRLITEQGLIDAIPATSIHLAPPHEFISRCDYEKLNEIISAVKQHRDTPSLINTLPRTQNEVPRLLINSKQNEHVLPSLDSKSRRMQPVNQALNTKENNGNYLAPPSRPNLINANSPSKKFTEDNSTIDPKLITSGFWDTFPSVINPILNPEVYQKEPVNVQSHNNIEEDHEDYYGLLKTQKVMPASTPNLDAAGHVNIQYKKPSKPQNRPETQKNVHQKDSQKVFVEQKLNKNIQKEEQQGIVNEKQSTRRRVSRKQTQEIVVPKEEEHVCGSLESDEESLAVGNEKKGIRRRESRKQTQEIVMPKEEKHICGSLESDEESLAVGPLMEGDSLYGHVYFCGKLETDRDDSLFIKKEEIKNSMHHAKKSTTTHMPIGEAIEFTPPNPKKQKKVTPPSTKEAPKTQELPEVAKRNPTLRERRQSSKNKIPKSETPVPEKQVTVFTEEKKSGSDVRRDTSRERRRPDKKKEDSEELVLKKDGVVVESKVLDEVEKDKTEMIKNRKRRSIRDEFLNKKEANSNENQENVENVKSEVAEEKLKRDQARTKRVGANKQDGKATSREGEKKREKDEKSPLVFKSIEGWREEVVYPANKGAKRVF